MIAQLAQSTVTSSPSAIASSTSSDDHRGGSRVLYCTHPNAIRYPQHTYRAIAQISHKSGRQAVADVVVINPCLAAIDKCLDAVLGSGWHTVSFQWADTSF